METYFLEQILVGMKPNVQVNSLSMPFFYVPGNHDLSNPWMEMEWKRRFSRSYYYFIHNNVLFLCINKQDGYEKIETELIGKNYSLFSGHSHTYLKLIKHGNNNFTLGSTDGGSGLFIS